MIRNNYLESIHDRVKNYCRTNYLYLNPEKFILGTGYFNRKCHMNAVQAVKEGKASKVLLTVLFTGSMEPMVHFINQDENGNFIDNTLGWKWEFYNYYVIKEVSEQEFDSIWHLLDDTKNFLLRINSNPFLNWLFRITNEIL